MAEGFKSSLMGFCKQEVIAYIGKLSSEYAKTIAEKDEEITMLREQNRELKKQLKEMKSELKGQNPQL